MQVEQVKEANLQAVTEFRNRLETLLCEIADRTANEQQLDTAGMIELLADLLGVTWQASINFMLMISGPQKLASFLATQAAFFAKQKSNPVRDKFTELLLHLSRDKGHG